MSSYWLFTLIVIQACGFFAAVAKGVSAKKAFWCLFFMLVPLLAFWICWVAPDNQWWFPNNNAAASSPLGQRIDDLFYMILIITTVTFVATQLALGYVLFTGARRVDDPAKQGEKAWYSHGSHNLEVIWTIVPAGVLLFIALYQMDVWADFRIQTHYPDQATTSMAEVTARQFEWRIRYPGLDEHGHPLELQPTPQPTDLYTVNELCLPSNRPVRITLRTDDVQHAFFLPELRIKQDAVPGLQIPIWFEANKSTSYTLLCAELCGWGHYKMKARFVAVPKEEYATYLKNLKKEQDYDGLPTPSEKTEKAEK